MPLTILRQCRHQGFWFLLPISALPYAWFLSTVHVVASVCSARALSRYYAPAADLRSTYPLARSLHVRVHVHPAHLPQVPEGIVIKKQRLDDDLASENAFADYILGVLPTKAKQLEKGLVVMGNSWISGELNSGNGLEGVYSGWVEGGQNTPSALEQLVLPWSKFQYQLGPYQTDGDLLGWVLDVKFTDWSLDASKTHLFNCRRVLEDSVGTVMWLGKRGWQHRDVHPSNMLVKLSADKRHIQSKKRDRWGEKRQIKERE